MFGLHKRTVEFVAHIKKLGPFHEQVQFSCSSWGRNQMGWQWACLPQALGGGAWFSGESLIDQPGPLAFEFATMDLK